MTYESTCLEEFCTLSKVRSYVYNDEIGAIYLDSIWSIAKLHRFDLIRNLECLKNDRDLFGVWSRTVSEDSHWLEVCCCICVCHIDWKLVREQR